MMIWNRVVCAGLLLGWMGCGICFAGNDRPAVAFRVHVQVNQVGDIEQVVPVRLFDPDEEILISRFSYLSENDVDNIRRYGETGAILQFSITGRNKLEAITQRERGKIMVVFFNGKVLLAAEIDQPISNGMLLIPEGLSDAELKAFELFIKKR